jgi:hypothetical protein
MFMSGEPCEVDANIFIGLARTICIYGVYTAFLAGKSPNIRSYTVHIYGFGQPYIFIMKGAGNV